MHHNTPRCRVPDGAIEEAWIALHHLLSPLLGDREICLEHVVSTKKERTIKDPPKKDPYLYLKKIRWLFNQPGFSWIFDDVLNVLFYTVYYWLVVFGHPSEKD